MQRNLRKLVSGTAVIATAVVAFPVAPVAAAAPSQDPEIVIGTDGDQEVAQRRRCRWVWRHGLVCETKLGTVVI